MATKLDAVVSRLTTLEAKAGVTSGRDAFLELAGLMDAICKAKVTKSPLEGEPYEFWCFLMSRRADGSLYEGDDFAERTTWPFNEINAVYRIIY